VKRSLILLRFVQFAKGEIEFIALLNFLGELEEYELDRGSADAINWMLRCFAYDETPLTQNEAAAFRDGEVFRSLLQFFEGSEQKWEPPARTRWGLLTRSLSLIFALVVLIACLLLLT
jgi:hypothetical protein